MRVENGIRFTRPLSQSDLDLREHPSLLGLHVADTATHNAVSLKNLRRGSDELINSRALREDRVQFPFLRDEVVDGGVQQFVVSKLAGGTSLKYHDVLVLFDMVQLPLW